MMKLKLLPFLLLFGLLLASCEKEDSMSRLDMRSSFGEAGLFDKTVEDCTTTVNLIVGQFYDAGEVTVWNDEENLYVRYSTDEEWSITETHLHIGENEDDFPLTRTLNPQIGKFTYGGYYDHKDEVTHTIPLSELWVGEYYIAAHAVLSSGEGSEDLDGFALILPETATVEVDFPAPGGAAYFNVHLSDADFLDGSHLGWCIESDVTISPGATYSGMIYSSYDENLPEEGVVKYPENLSKVNWILNQKFVGKTVEGLGTFTYGDVQHAIWKLLSIYPSSFTGILGFNEARLDAILAGAEAYEDEFGPFRPECDELFAILLKIDGAQNILIEYPVPCKKDDDETAWGGGTLFTERGNWAMWFTHEYCLD